MYSQYGQPTLDFTRGSISQTTPIEPGKEQWRRIADHACSFVEIRQRSEPLRSTAAILRRRSNAVSCECMYSNNLLHTLSDAATAHLRVLNDGSRVEIWYITI